MEIKTATGWLEIDQSEIDKEILIITTGELWLNKAQVEILILHLQNLINI